MRSSVSEEHTSFPQNCDAAADTGTMVEADDAATDGSFYAHVGNWHAYRSRRVSSHFCWPAF